MNAIHKYLNDAYRYVLLLIPANCICAGLTYTCGKMLGWYENAAWFLVLLFDFSQLLYLFISFCFIRHKKNVGFYNNRDIRHIKIFVTIALFLQYNFIMNLFPTPNAWSCTFIFMGIVAFLFDTRLMLIHISGYTISLIVAHGIHWEQLLPEHPDIRMENIVYRTIVYILTSIAFIFITYLVERFLIQEQEQEAENMYLMEKQLDYYQSCDYMDKELRKFRHDIKGHFLGMQYLLQNKSYEELNNYFKDLNDSFSFQENFYYSGNLIIDSILNHDIANRCHSHVKTHISGRMTELSTVSAIDLCTLFCNMLSNAITAANQCTASDDAQLNVYFDCGSQYFSITIINSTPEKYHTDSAATSKKATQRDRNHGHGMKKIKDICEKYNGDFRQSHADNKVTTIVYLPL